MTDSPTPADHPPGASLHLGGAAWANPTLEPLLVPIDTLIPYPGNPRRGDQDAITSSIRDHGLYAGVVTQTSTRHILVGNHRRHALIELGATLIPAAPHDCDDTLAAAIVARDNRTSDRGSYDPTDQVALLDRLVTAGVDLGPLGFDASDLLILQRRSEAEEIWAVGAVGMLDEFRAISGNDGPVEYDPGYKAKAVVYFRSDAAVKRFEKALGLADRLSSNPIDSRGWTFASWKRYYLQDEKPDESATA